jgi:GT2 family glycosyltransferase
VSDSDRPAVQRPRVRLVVLNYNGGNHVVRCLEHLHRLDWPADRLELVVIDNASRDGSDARIEKLFGGVRLIRSQKNLGFPGNNLALGDLESVSYVGLVNNDAFVSPGWLAPLAGALDHDPRLGAACPKILFDDQVLPLEMLSATFQPPGDARQLGVRLSGVRVSGVDIWSACRLLDGFFPRERGSKAEPEFHWSTSRALLAIPATTSSTPITEVEVRLAAATDTKVTFVAGTCETTALVTAEPAWLRVPMDGEPVDLVNNVGSRLVERGYGGDRGFEQLDRGQFDDPAEVFAWCGGGVLLRREYLEDVGLFDERFFLYYEDTDLAWRGRARGWSYRYVPEAVQRHLHAASSGEWSPLFRHFVERNRLLMLVKNAPLKLAGPEVARFVAATVAYALRDIVRPLARARRPSPALAWSRAKSFVDFTRLLPAMLVDRRRLRRRQTVPDRELLAWMEPI